MYSVKGSGTRNSGIYKKQISEKMMTGSRNASFLESNCHCLNCCFEEKLRRDHVGNILTKFNRTISKELFCAYNEIYLFIYLFIYLSQHFIACTHFYHHMLR